MPYRRQTIKSRSTRNRHNTRLFRILIRIPSVMADRMANPPRVSHTVEPVVRTSVQLMPKLFRIGSLNGKEQPRCRRPPPRRRGPGQRIAVGKGIMVNTMRGALPRCNWLRAAVTKTSRFVPFGVTSSRVPSHIPCADGACIMAFTCS